MNKINFEPIRDAMRAFDTDKMDIYRRMEIENPDGTSGETGLDTLIYSNKACHISFISADNPDAATVICNQKLLDLKYIVDFK